MKRGSAMDYYQFMWSDRDYFEDFITRSTFHSNAIEGNTLTLAETYAILWNDNSLQIKATARELYEAINHKVALTEAMEDRDPDLREALIKRVGIAINHNVNEISGYRKVPVFIRGAEHIPPDPAAVVQQMMELVYTYNNDVRAGRDPFEREAEFHIRFERIHPFEDGNGRTGRILLERGLLLSGHAPAVVSIENRAEYLELINAVDIEGMASFLRDASESEAKRAEAFKAIAEAVEKR